MSQIADNIKRVRENVQRAAQQCGRDAEDITLIAVTKTVDVDAMEEAEVHREEVRWRWSVDNCGSDRGFWRGNRTGRTDRNTAGKLVDRDNTFSDVSSVSVVWSDYSFVLLRIERIFSIKTSQKRKKD